MKIAQQVKQRRQALGISQEELAEQVYVTRQTVSNWETGKSYPDIGSLIRLGDFFGVSLDTLIKGDLEEMKEQINETDRKRFDRDSAIYTGLFLATILSLLPLARLFHWAGAAVWLALAGVTFYYALRVERQKKAFDIHTYQEIVAFSQGKRLDEIEKAREAGKWPYQRVLLAVASGVVTFAICLGMALLLKVLA